MSGRSRSHWGCCPVCGREGVIHHVGRNHFMVCETNQAAWYLGSNLFSAWREQTPEDTARTRELLENCVKVEPVFGIGEIARLRFRVIAGGAE